MTLDSEPVTKSSDPAQSSMSNDPTDSVVRTVDHQTTPVQPDQVAVHKLVMILSGHGGEDADAVRATVDEAVADGRLERDGEHVWVAEDYEVPHDYGGVSN